MSKCKNCLLATRQADNIYLCKEYNETVVGDDKACKDHFIHRDEKEREHKLSIVEQEKLRDEMKQQKQEEKKQRKPAFIKTMTKEQEDIIRNSPKITKELAESLGTSVAVLRQVKSKLGLTKKYNRMPKVLPIEHINFIKENSGKMTVTEMANNLKVTEAYVRNIRKQYNLSDLKFFKTKTEEQKFNDKQEHRERVRQAIEKHANDTRRQDFILKIYTALIQVANPINHDELLKQAAASADKILNNEI